MSSITITVTQTGTVSASPSRLTLVSPTYVWALGNTLPLFSELEIHFVLEPGTGVLLAAGLVGIAVAGRRRHRSSSVA